MVESCSLNVPFFVAHAHVPACPAVLDDDVALVHVHPGPARVLPGERDRRVVMLLLLLLLLFIVGTCSAAHLQQVEVPGPILVNLNDNN